MTSKCDDIVQLIHERSNELQTFRNRVKDVITPAVDDEFLMRFFKARRFDMAKAEKMFREHMKFRRNIGVDNILNEYKVPKIVLNHFPYYFIGFDKHGNSVMSFLAGAIDFKGFFNSLSTLDTVKCLIVYVESALKKMADENRKTGRNSNKLIIIFDLNGMQVRQLMDRTVGKQLIDFLLTFEYNYPERLKTIYTLNVPSFFHAWFSVLKKFLDPEITKKFVLYSRGGWEEDLLKEIDADILPAIFGGNLTDPDGNTNCETLYTRDNKIPTTLYLKSNKTKFAKDPARTEVLVKERTYYNHFVYVKELRSIIRWVFQTLDYNIAFAVYFVPSGVKPMPKVSIPKVSKSFRHRVRRGSKDGHEIIVPSERVESHVIPEQGEIQCEKTGTYVIHFDNTFSWMTPKTLSYKVELLPPTAPVLGLEGPRPGSGYIGADEQMKDIIL